MISLRNRGKYPKAIREEFEHFAARLGVFLGQLFDEDGNLIDRSGNVLVDQEEGPVVAPAVTKIRHEDISFGSGEASKTIDATDFDGFHDAAEDEVMFTFHGPFTDWSSAAVASFSVSMDPSTFPSVTFRRTWLSNGESDTNFPASTYYWSMWRRRSE